MNHRTTSTSNEAPLLKPLLFPETPLVSTLRHDCGLMKNSTYLLLTQSFRANPNYAESFGCNRAVDVAIPTSEGGGYCEVIKMYRR